MHSPRLNRYLSLTAYAVTGCVIAMVLIQLLGPDHSGVITFLESLQSPRLIIAIVALMVIGFIYLLWRYGALPLKHPFSVRYPPLWSVAMLAVGCATAFCPARYLAHDWWDIGIVFLPLLFAMAVAHLTNSVAMGRIKRARLTLSENARRTQVPKWVIEERALRDESDDALGREHAVSRVTDNLKAGRPTAILGAFGSGKSTLINFVEKRLRDEGHLVCQVSAWGLSSSDVAQVLLRKVIMCIGARYDVSAFRGLPSEYASTLRAATGWISPYMEGILDTSPDESLTRISDALAAAGARLFIFIEDLDRTLDVEAIRATYSLLDLLKPLSNVNYAVAIDLRDDRTDLVRLFEHHEVLLPLGEPQVHAFLEELVYNCWDAYGDDRLTEKPTRIDPRLGVPSAFSQWSFDEAEPTVSEALTTLISSPRRLKAVRRRVVDGWRELHGEVSLIDLVIETVLLVSVPKVWWLVNASYADLRKLNRQRSSGHGHGEDSTKQFALIRARLTESFDALAIEPRERVAVSILINELFPSWTRESFEARGGATQRVKNDVSDKYWRRLVSHAVDDPITDQAFLRSIEELVAGKPYSIVAGARNADSTSAALLSQFSNHLPREALEVLVKCQAQYLLEDRESKDSFDESEFLLTAIDALTKRKVDTFFAVSLLEAALKTSLVAFVELDSRLSTKVSDPRSFRTELAAKIPRWMPTVTNWLAAAPLSVESDHLFALHWVVRQMYLESRGVPRFKPTDWRWFAPIAVALALQDEVRFRPLLATLISKSVRTDGKDDWDLDREFLEEWIPYQETRRDLLRCLLQTTSPGTSKDRARKFEQLRGAILAYLAEPEVACPSSGSGAETPASSGDVPA